MAMSDYLEEALLNHVLRNTPYTPPAVVYLVLYTSAPTDAGGGTEVAGGSYARKPVTYAAPAPGMGQTSNSTVVTFTNLPACTVVAVGLKDALTGGNLLFHEALSSPVTYTAGQNVSLAVGDVITALD